MAFYHTLFNGLFKRNSVYVGTIFASAFVFQAVFDEAVTTWYEKRNAGKLWKDLKPKVLAGFEADDDDE